MLLPWMQQLGPAIFKLLASDQNVKNLVGTRIFPHGSAKNPQMPYITYVIPLADRQIYAHAEQEPVGNFIEIQIDWWCPSYEVAMRLGDALYQALECADITIPGWSTGRLFAWGGWPIETATEGGTTYWRGTRRYRILQCRQ